MTKIKLEDYNSLIRDIKELQIICRKYRDENKDLKKQLKKFKNLGKEIPDFMRGFAKK